MVESSLTQIFNWHSLALFQVYNSDVLPEYILGLFQDDHMDYHLKANNQPTLEEMVEVAIKMLSRNKNGYFLFVEGEEKTLCD